MYLWWILCQKDYLVVLYLDSGKATGRFSTPIDTLKLIRYNFKTSGNNLNSSFSNGIVPDSFKIVIFKINQVHKNGSTLKLNNYRLLSLLSVVNKLLEKLMFKRISNFINKHNILYSK